MKKYRIRELTMTNGEVRFIPERLESPTGWILVGVESYFLTMEQARQMINQNKAINANKVVTETIHEMD